MNHKRKKPKSSRAGCLMCKPHKHQRAKDKKSSLTIRDRKALDRYEDESFGDPCHSD